MQDKDRSSSIMEQEKHRLELCFTEGEIEALMRLLKTHPEMQEAPEEVTEWTKHLLKKLQE